MTEPKVDGSAQKHRVVGVALMVVSPQLIWPGRPVLETPEMFETTVLDEVWNPAKA